MKKAFLLFSLFYTITFVRAQNSYLDSSFNHVGILDGFVVNGFPVVSGISKVLAIQSDGKILATLVDFTLSIDIIRINADGSTDTGFANKGIFSAPLQSSATGYAQVRDVFYQQDGKILLLGNALFPNSGTSRDVVLFRLLSNGTPDSSFGNNGSVITSSFGYDSNDDGLKILQRPNGKIIICGSVYPSQYGMRQLVIQYHANGTLDTQFGANINANGILTYQVGGRENFVTGALLQPDGKILLYGTIYTFLNNMNTYSTGFIARYNTNGDLDNNFGNNGYIETTSGTSVFGISLREIALLPDGKIIVGFSKEGVTTDTMVFKRFLPNGQLDMNFGIGGASAVFLNSGTNRLADIVKIISLPNDFLLVGANSALAVNKSDFTVFLLQPNGKLDSNWGNKGLIVANAINGNDYLSDMALQNDGKVILCGGHNGNNPNSYASRLVRFKAIPLSVGFANPFYNAGKLKIYPNPTTSTVRIEGALAGDQVTVWNAMGQAVLVQKISTPVLELGALPAGLYQVLVQRKGVVVGSGKLVKE